MVFAHKINGVYVLEYHSVKKKKKSFQPNKFHYGSKIQKWALCWKFKSLASIIFSFSWKIKGEILKPEEAHYPFIIIFIMSYIAWSAQAFKYFSFLLNKVNFCLINIFVYVVKGSRHLFSKTKGSSLKQLVTMHPPPQKKNINIISRFCMGTYNDASSEWSWSYNNPFIKPYLVRDIQNPDLGFMFKVQWSQIWLCSFV